MKKTKKIVIILFITLFLCCFSQVKAADIEVENESDIIKINESNLKDSILRSSYNSILKNSETLEATYNLKDNLQSLIVKNQKASGSCWAFSFSSILETSIAKQYNKISKEYSPMHIEYKTTQMFNRTLGSGAGPRLSIAYCLSGNGPVIETKMPFSSVYDDQTGFKSLTEVGNLSTDIDARVKDVTMFSNIYKNTGTSGIEYSSNSSGTKTYTSEELEAIRKLIKEHIKTYGSVSAEMYLDTTNYYNTQTSAYNYNVYTNKANVNHQVTIVGWDDTYNADNFKDGTKPTSNGAYIVLNSYGSEWGDGGYMYISYEDAYIEQDLIGIKEIEEYEDENKDYNQIYQHDELGMNLGLPLVGTSLYAADKYTREQVTDKDEYIQEVGLYIAATSGVEVYINPDGDSFANATLVAVPENALEAGYHTIKLASPIKLTGDTFAVIVKYTNQENAYIPLEVNYKDFGMTNETSYFYDNATSNAGESFVSADGQNWTDLYDTYVNVSGTQYNLKNSSTCIKAFTTYQAKAPETVAVTSVQLDKTQLSILVGGTEMLVPTVLPENATNKNVTWTSSDETVATVENGVITGKKEGTATITVTTVDGSKTATCVVTVQKQEIQNVAVTGVELNKTQTTISVGNTETLVETVLPENSTNKNITWTSSDETVATVENGVITGKKEGTATITVTTVDGNKTAVCTVSVISSRNYRRKYSSRKNRIK